MLKLLEEQRRVLLIDPSGEYEFGAVCESLGDVCDFLTRHPDRFHLRIETRDVEKMDRLAWIACDFGRQSGAITFAIDEAPIFTEPEFISEGLAEIVDRGAKWRTSFICTMHRLTDVHSSIRRQADKIYFFNLHDWYEAALARRYLGPAKTDQLMRLGKGEYFRWPDADTKKRNDARGAVVSTVPDTGREIPEIPEVGGG